MEVKQGARGLWYAGNVGFATRQQAEQHAKKLLTPVPMAAPGGVTKWQVYGPFVIVGGVLVAVAVATLLFLNFGSSKAGPKWPVSQGLAAMYCQKLFTSLAIDREKADVPFVLSSSPESDPEYYFAWGNSTKNMRMRNGLGLEVPVSGTCIVDKLTGNIKSATLDGKTVH